MVTGRCMRCKKQVEIKNGISVKTSRGTPMTKGKCPYCGTSVCRIGA